MQQGWIGDWSPGTRDTTAGGWIAPTQYLCAAWACHQVVGANARILPTPRGNGHLIRRWLAMGMGFLGFTQQRRLQSAVHELACAWAYEQSWCRNRRQYQQAFVAAVPVAVITRMTMMTVLVWTTLVAPSKEQR